MANRLAGESSPYLRQHAANPVDWYPWGDEAFQRARAERKPVLLSVGYSACHWCHVMAHESFEDPKTASLMNQWFVNVKVDREERPDVDSVYMQAVQAMTGHGGWPMTVFLTPAGAPFFGGTYFPPEDRHGMPAFARVLQAAADAYRSNRHEVETSAERIRAALRVRTPEVTGDVDPGVVGAAANALVRQTSPGGGFGGAPKFPHPMAIDLLLHQHAVSGDPSLLEAALVTLDAMARGGIHDQVGGGFHRYSVDATWSVPHFEKMLYDNAQLAPVYLHAYQLTGRADLLDVCTQTLDYLVREMLLPSQGFAASQDADSPGGEGAYFVWTPEQLRTALGDADAELAARVFGVTEEGNFEHGATVLSQPRPLPDVAATLGIEESALRERVDDLRRRLRAARASRPQPARDDKVLTAWNALAVAAFAETGAVLRREDYALVARRSAQFIVEAMMSDGVPKRSWMDGQARITGFLEDCAHLANALLTVYEASGEPRFFDIARELCDQIPERFRDGTGTYFDTAGDAEQLIARPRSIDDNPVAAGQSTAAMAFARLHGLTGDATWRERAIEIVRPLAAVIPRAPLGLGSLALALQRLSLDGVQVAIAGDPGDAATLELVATAWRPLVPGRVIAWGSADAPLLQGRAALGGRPAAYVCHHFECLAPVTDPVSLQAALSR
jgi:uncharacterized protein